jgi:hypothetical protein
VELSPEVRASATAILYACATTAVFYGLVFAAVLFSQGANSAGEGDYKRSYFRHWVDADRDCENTRAETLITQSILLTEMDAEGCRVITGMWFDPYTGTFFFNAKDLDIDHIVPLKAAWDAGADQWEKGGRKKFANDPDNLLAVSATENRRKGAKTLLQWKPPSEAYRCEYALRWLLVKVKYELETTLDEWAELSVCTSGHTSPEPH